MGQKLKSFEGYLLGIFAYLIWGILPIYWKQLTTCTSLEILSYRIVGSFIFLILLVVLLKRKGFLVYLKEKRTRNALMMTGVLISINWGVFIFAVNSDQVVQASLGYYINPLISVLLGMIVLKERMTKLQLISLCLAFCAVLFMTISYGVFPWISLILAISFALYGLLKKINNLDSLLSLLGELLILLPFVIGYLVYLFSHGNGQFLSGNLTINMIVLFAGVVTVIPLYLFAEGTKKIALSSIGFLQYIAPTMMLLIGVILYHEPFTAVHKISFILIWIALGLYAFSILHKKKGEINVDHRGQKSS